MSRTMTGTRVRNGAELVAAALAGAWRHAPPALEMSAEELDNSTSLLVRSGAAALIWRRVRQTERGAFSSTTELQQSSRLQSLQATLHEQSVKQSFTLLRAAGVEPILLKGWAGARLYPETSLRSSGDVDLCVRPEQRAPAEAVLRSPACEVISVIDLQHEKFAALADSQWDQLYARSQLVKLGETDVRVLGPEDHLRFLCVHLLHHSAYRPLWLCDIAVALESRPTDFDWDLCLSGTRQQTNWVACSIVLAQQLLGAQMAGVPSALKATRLPTWFVPQVLKQWERPCTQDRLPHELMATSLRHPTRAPGALRQRWPDPILATINRRKLINEAPRLPIQLVQYFIQAATFLRRPLSSWRRR